MEELISIKGAYLAIYVILIWLFYKGFSSRIGDD